MEEIKRWIEFGIKHGFKEKVVEGELSFLEALENGFEQDIVQYKMYLPVITSKEFITAVAKGIIKKNVTGKIKESKSFLKGNMDGLTIKQAIAIRDNKLPEFIKQLGI